jgi:hypothetical protein
VAQHAGPIEVDGGPAGNCKTSAQVAQSGSPPAGAGLNSITAPRIEANPHSLARRERNLARYQRRMARFQRGSANRAKAKAKVARAHRKVRASRADFLHRAPTRLVRDHDVIVIEDLAVKNMVRNRSLAKAICDCGWGTFPCHGRGQGGQGRTARDRDRPLVSQLQDVQFVRAPARGAFAEDPDVAVSVLRHPARPGHQRR